VRGGATLSEGELVLVSMSEWANVAVTPAPGSGEMSQFGTKDNRNVPRVMVPNVYGLIGDPRREQMAYGLDDTNVYKLFDGKAYTGTDLWEIEFPHKSVRPGAKDTLRGARIVMEFEQPRPIRGLGVWERAGDLPVQTMALEYCNSYEIDEMTRELHGDWKLACAVRNNRHYYHVHTFEPKKAKVWRLTIIDTPAKLQRLAEIELYEEVIDSLFNLDAEDDGGDGLFMP
jgi:hypothetical protein